VPDVASRSAVSSGSTRPAVGPSRASGWAVSLPARSYPHMPAAQHRLRSEELPAARVHHGGAHTDGRVNRRHRGSDEVKAARWCPKARYEPVCRGYAPVGLHLE
jgi:hypothetical protein